MRSKWVHWLVVPAAVVLLAAGCGDDDDDDGSTTDTTEEGTDTTEPETSDTTEATDDEPTAQTVSLIGDDNVYSEVPTEVEAGLIEITFENQGEVPHEAQMASIGDTPVDTFVADFAAVIEGGPVPDYVESVTGVGEVAPGETLTASFTVTEGNYVWFCTLDGDPDAPPPAEGEEPTSGPLHFADGMIEAVTVVEGEADATLPEADGTITAVDYGFEVDVEAGEGQTINFVNEGPDEVHHAVLFPFVEGTDEAAAEAALQTFLSSEDAPPPPEIDLAAIETTGASAAYSGGLGGTFEANFESGRTYAVVCFISDRSGGPPHVIAHDMKEIFTVE